jgi:hypothetical protein
MKFQKDQSLSERLERAAKARQAIIDKFKAQPKADDPEVIRRREEQIALAEARRVREAEKAERKRQEAEALAAQKAKEKAEREAAARRAAIEAVIRGEAIAAEQKAKRDARYAARKARKAGKS